MKRKGAAAVEFAIIAPFFFMLLMGMLEVGRAVHVQQVITNATREAVRCQSVGEDGVKRVEKCLKNAGISRFKVKMDPPNPESGQPVTCTVRVKFTDVSWVPVLFYVKDLQASTIMRRE